MVHPSKAGGVSPPPFDLLDCAAYPVVSSSSYHPSQNIYGTFPRLRWQQQQQQQSKQQRQRQSLEQPQSLKITSAMALHGSGSSNCISNGNYVSNPKRNDHDSSLWRLSGTTFQTAINKYPFGAKVHSNNNTTAGASLSNGSILCNRIYQSKSPGGTLFRSAAMNSDFLAPDIGEDSDAGSEFPLRDSRSGHGSGCCARSGTWLERYIRPVLSELFAVFFSAFCVTLVESSQLTAVTNRALSSFIISIIEGGLFVVLSTTFYNCSIHLNPVITMAALFCGGTSPILTVLYWFVQISGSCFGVYCYQAVATDFRVNVPVLINLNDKTWFFGIYQVVICQAITCAMVVCCYLMTFIDPPDLQNMPQRNPNGVAAAITIASFTSLLLCTATWNPMRTLALCIVSTLHNVEITTWSYHYIFWLGPIIGALFASFFYRLVFAEHGKRLNCKPQRH